MNQKLTLTVEQSVVEKAKLYAKAKGSSLSNIIENYLKAITKSDDSSVEKLSPLIKSLQGSFKMPKDFDYKKELENALTEKYL
ncbi:MAG: hypothetical protein GY936_13525 [Ignavibacteriae bacterium]|nr:hypothetical protein [Ignavibacteriota bacterium]